MPGFYPVKSYTYEALLIFTYPNLFYTRNLKYAVLKSPFVFQMQFEKIRSDFQSKLAINTYCNFRDNFVLETKHLKSNNNFKNWNITCCSSSCYFRLQYLSRKYTRRTQSLWCPNTIAWSMLSLQYYKIIRFVYLNRRLL